MLALQPLVGNQAITAMLEKCRMALPRPTALQVQRKIGFEFEENTWDSYAQTGPPAPQPVWTRQNPLYTPKHRPGGVNIWARQQGDHINQTVGQYNAEAFTKKDKLHEGDGFNLEADGPYSKGKMDIEFVTKPFEETKAGRAELKAAMAGIGQIMKRLNGLSPMPRKAENGQFYGPNEHQLSNNQVLLSAGSPRASFKMQVTHGVRLEDIPRLFATFGAPIQGETKEEAKARGPARRLIPDDPGLDLQRRILAESPVQAGLVVNGLENARVIQGDTAALTGFLTYALAYIQWLQVLPWSGLKVALPFMSRYDFAKLFTMLPTAQQQALNAGHGRKVLQHLIGAVVQRFGIMGKRSKPLGLTSPLMSFEPGTTKFPAAHLQFFALIERLTTEDWINGILDGRDHLTGTGIYQYLSGSGFAGEAGQYEKSLHVHTRGHGATKTLVGAENDLAIMENRIVDPVRQGLDAEQAAEVALSYFSFMVDLRKKQNAKFPQMKL